MLTRVLRDSVGRWRHLVETEDASGGIPLPAVESIAIYEDRDPVVSLVAPDAVPDSWHVFVSVSQMSAADRLALDALLEAMDRQVNSAEQDGSGGWLRVNRVTHLGGLDYELVLGQDKGQPAFYQPEERRILTSEQSDEYRAVIWGLLRAIALLTRHYPDVQASTPKAY